MIFTSRAYRRAFHVAPPTATQKKICQKMPKTPRVQNFPDFGESNAEIRDEQPARPATEPAKRRAACEADIQKFLGSVYVATIDQIGAIYHLHYSTTGNRALRYDRVSALLASMETRGLIKCLYARDGCVREARLA